MAREPRRPLVPTWFIILFGSALLLVFTVSYLAAVFTGFKPDPMLIWLLGGFASAVLGFGFFRNGRDK